MSAYRVIFHNPNGKRDGCGSVEFEWIAKSEALAVAQVAQWLIDAGLIGFTFTSVEELPE